jgi:hypothetical protein
MFAGKGFSSWLVDLASRVTGTLPVANGGTGKATITANSYLKGNGTGALVERTYTEVITDLGLSDALTYKGVIDCSANPNYPAANAGDYYKISGVGKIGGAAGIVVELGDAIICNLDSSPSGDQATVGANWNKLQTNIDLANPGAIGGTTPAAGTFSTLTGTTEVWATATELTLASDAITVTQTPHLVDTQADAASDDLVTINGGSAGQLLAIRAAHADRTVVIKNGTGNILTGGADITLDDTNKYVLFIYDGLLSKWVVVGGTGGGASAFSDYAFLSIDAGIDGTAAPSAAVITASTNKAITREFPATADKDLFFVWQPPPDWNGGTITFRVIGFITNATAPADTETAIFGLAGASIADSELISSALGSIVTATFTANATYAQYDRWSTAWSTAVTIAGAAAGETVLLNLLRDVDDTYEQPIGVVGIEVKFTRTLAA